jgi:hypothetical protein
MAGNEWPCKREIRNDEIKGNEDNDKGEGIEESDTFVVVIFRYDTTFWLPKRRYII